MLSSVYRPRHEPLSSSSSSSSYSILFFFSSKPKHSPHKTTHSKIKSPIPYPPIIPNAITICNLLSNHNTNTTNFDHLLTDFTHQLNSQLILQVLMNYKQLGRTKTLEFFSWAGRQMGFKLDHDVIEYMADFLCRRKLFDDLKCFLLTVSSNGSRLSCRCFSTCIRFLGREGRVEEALSLFKEMESTFRCVPDNLVCNNVLYVLCKKVDTGCFIDVAVTIFRNIESPDAYSYSNILVGLCKYGRVETALQVFREMGGSGLVPTRSALNVFIGELCLMSSKEGNVEKVRVKSSRRPFTILVPNLSASKGAIGPATEVFWAVHELGLLPSAFVINMLISELCRLGKLEEAVQVLKVVEDKKLNSLEVSYGVVIKALCENREVDEVSRLFGRMLSHGFKPKLVVYNYIIGMLCKMGNLDDAERVFKLMNQKRCFPDNVTYTALVHAYSEVKNWETAYNLLTEMLGLGWCPHFSTYNLVDKLLREHNRVELAIRLEAKYEMQILLKQCKEGRLEAAYEMLTSMLEKGLYLPTHVRDVFEHAFQKSGKLKLARELTERMNKSICKPERADFICAD